MKPFYALKVILIAVLLSGLNLTGFAQTTTFTYSYTGSVQSIVCPANLTAVYVDMQGAKGGVVGGFYPNASRAGYGGRVQCVVAVTPGVTYFIYAGGAGTNGSTTAPGAGGYNGGGVGALTFGGTTTPEGGGGGGGATDIRVGGTTYANRLVVAGGGGGDGLNTASISANYENGGDGGGLIGLNGVYANSVTGTQLGQGGTQISGGIGATAGTPNGFSGGFGYGGAATPSPSANGGGGGGGYYGGGGGYNGGGGGGSSFTDPVLASSSVTHTQAYNSTGSGSVFIATGLLTPSSPSLTFGSVVVSSVTPVQVFTVTGVNLLAAIGTPTVNVTAPAGFLVSATGNPGTFSSGFNVPYTPPTIAASAPVPIFVEFAPAAYSSYSANIVVSAGGAFINVPVTGYGIFPCSGAPSISAATASPIPGTPPITLSVAPVPTVAGVNYQWYSYATGATGGFSAISGGTTATYIYTPPGTSPYVNTFYYCVATCSYSGQTTTSATIENLSSTSTPCSGIVSSSPTANYTYAATPQGCSPGYATNVFLVTPHTDPSFTYNWQISTTGPSSGFSPIANATNPYYTENVTGGTVWLNVVITCSTNLAFATSRADTITLNPSPTAITGSPNICLGTPTAFGSTPPGGTWTSSALISISPATGFATGVAAGSASITYTLPTGCMVTTTAAVNTAASSIAGSPNVCPGTTVSLTDLVSGGTWSSSIPGAATVGAGTGVVTGSSAGTSIISYTLSNGCFATLPITINPLPGPIGGSASVCVGQPDILSDATAGGTWASSNTFLASIGSASGIASGVASGTPTIAYILPTGCQSTLALTVNSLPAAISGRDTVCAGTTTNLTDGGGTWSSSSAALATVGSATGVVTGVAAGIPMITYYAPATGCWVTTPVTVNALPVAGVVTEPGGGGYCPGGTGVRIGLSTSYNDINYYLYYGSTIVDELPGASSALNFGYYTAVGTYSVLATNALTGCSNAMAGSVTVYNYPLPTADSILGGGSYCAGGNGVNVYLNNSTLGVNYQLYIGGLPTTIIEPGTGTTMSFGMESAAGDYTAVAMNTSTLCSNMMLSDVNVAILPVPAMDTVTGGGNYCLGGTGVSVSLTNSTLGIFYKLYRNSILDSTILSVGGGPVSFGNQVAAGNYTVVALNNADMCTTNMAGSAAIIIDSLPIVYATTGGGSYCAGGGGVHVGLDYGVVGTNYLLYMGGTWISTIAGSNSGVDFGAQTTAGVYSIVGKYVSTGCLDTMGNVNVTIDSLPTAYTVNGTAGYCTGVSGSPVSLSGSESGHNYKYMLYRGGTLLATDNGTGSSLNFGPETSGIYKVVALDTISTCTRTMTDSAVITVNPLPSIYNLSGGGNYCSGGTGMPVMLSGSQSGIQYKLSLTGGGVVSTMAGSGSSLNFGLETASGNYAAVATNTVTGCFVNMTGTATIGVNPLPALYTVSGGGAECAGGAGFPVNLSLSTPGTSYRLYNTGWVGSALLGSGSSLYFGVQTAAGNYRVVATNLSTSCIDTMTGSALITVHALPTKYTVTGGGAFCAGSGSAPVALSYSDITDGVTYSLYNGATLDTTLAGVGHLLNFGSETVSGTYIAVATTVYGCTDTMLSGAIVTARPTPLVYDVTGGGTFCANDTGVHIFLSNSTTYVNYQVYRGLTAVGGFWAGTGLRLDLGLDSIGGTYKVKATDVTTGCTSSMADSAILVVTPLVTPAVTISTGSGDTVCSGTSITFFANPVNGGSTPAYQWNVGGTVVSSAPTYTYVPADGDVVSVLLTSDANCAYPATANGSIAVTVNPNETPVVTISTPSTLVCPGTTVTFTSATSYAGPSPTYSWMVNGHSVGVTGPVYTYVPLNNDAVVLGMTSDYPCLTRDYVPSNPVIMTMDTPAVPVFTISGGNAVEHLQSLTLTADVSNVAASMLTYQWSVNGFPVSGSNSASYTSGNFNNGDMVCCSIFSTNECGTSAISTQCETITVTGNLGVSQVNNNSNIQVSPNPNKGAFTIKGTFGSGADEPVTLEITNVLGQVVYSSNVTLHNGAINEQIQLNSELANGMYLLNIHSGSESAVFHFVIEQ